MKAVPGWLRPGGVNPLGQLFKAFSEEVHACDSDDAALAVATDLRDVFELVVTSVVRHVRDAKQLQAQLQRRR